MEKIEKLTAKQKQQMIEFREEWRQIGLATGPANIDAIRDAINAEYAEIGEKPPVLWRCESPLMAQLVINVLKKYNAVEQNLWQNLWQNLEQNLWQNLRQNLWQNLRQNLRQNLEQNLEQNLWQNLRQNLEQNLEQNLWQNLRQNLRRNLDQNLEQNLRRNLEQNLWQNLGQNLWQNLGQNLWDNLRDNLRQNLEFVSSWFWGSLDSYWIAYYLFPHIFLRKMHTEKQMERLDRYVTIAKNAFWFYPFSGICFVCDRPNFIGMDTEWRLHAINRPAIEFSDGWKLYYVHGVQVPDFVIENPQKITSKIIEDEGNVEVRRVMLDIFGWNKYLQGVEPIHQDRFGILYRREIPGDEPLVIVKVKNSTPESDGTYKDYFLRVPPTIKTAHEAVAWTFDETPETYNPAVES